MTLQMHLVSIPNLATSLQSVHQPSPLLKCSSMPGKQIFSRCSAQSPYIVWDIATMKHFIYDTLAFLIQCLPLVLVEPKQPINPTSPTLDAKQQAQAGTQVFFQLEINSLRHQHWLQPQHQFYGSPVVSLKCHATGNPIPAPHLQMVSHQQQSHF